MTVWPGWRWRPFCVRGQKAREKSRHLHGRVRAGDLDSILLNSYSECTYTYLGASTGWDNTFSVINVFRLL